MTLEASGALERGVLVGQRRANTAATGQLLLMVMKSIIVQIHLLYLLTSWPIRIVQVGQLRNRRAARDRRVRLHSGQRDGLRHNRMRWFHRPIVYCTILTVMVGMTISIGGR